MSQNIESLLQESRLFEPPADFAARARVSGRAAYDEMRRKASEDPEAYWAAAAKELHWFQPWKTVLEWNAPFA